ncbi:hypothetical protein H5V45_11910 [Nocardioides sp. KIGAM211]|uniref:Uncharacterized protein n=1 Tax=Nocardioides luti TaxID=2761101 RepID=A0A7X0RGR0_9ACTN|nr:hypothetical protein [Nocardioides luti]MBB6628023.1 hypothetical protein [Nocardioides luti]
MTPHPSKPRHRRSLAVATGLLALVAPLAAVAVSSAPAEASNTKTHHVKMYKVEAQVDLDGEYPDNSTHTHLSCGAGDYALDGMWRVDSVDQANPDTDTFGDERDVEVTASYGDTADMTKWHFEITNRADGDAQLKIFLTCLQGTTEGQHGHSHAITVTNKTLPASNNQADGDWEKEYTAQCAVGQYAVAPGFKIANGSARPYGSYMTTDFRGWKWGFVNSSTPDIQPYLRCLTIRTGAAGAGGHVHKLYAQWFPGYAGDMDFVPVKHQTERQYSCTNKFYDKGMVASWWINDHQYTYWLGMDPRPKTRAFRYWREAGGDGKTYIALLCIGTRTSKQQAP